MNIISWARGVAAAALTAHEESLMPLAYAKKEKAAKAVLLIFGMAHRLA